MKRILSLALALVLTAGVLPAVAPSASAGYGSSGRFLVPVAGTPSGASIAISNVLGLVQIGRDVGYPLNGTYHLTDDIDLSAIIGDWTPIGDGTPNGFTGVFDGQGHVIKGLKIDTWSANIGLFAQISSSAVVKNVGLESAHISTTQLISSVVIAGGICGRNAGTISNCYNAGITVSLSSSDSVTTGGICGVNEGAGTVIDCYNDATVYATSTTKAIAGGICGSSSGTIEKCSNTGFADAVMYGFGSYPPILIFPHTLIAGGICGETTAGQITNCQNTGDAFITSLVDTPSGTTFAIGGLCGRNGGLIKNCYNSGMVDVWPADPSIPSLSPVDLGGICGTNLNSGIVNDCYSTSRIDARPADVFGAICGNNSGTITNTYWDEACQQYVNGIAVPAMDKKGIGFGTGVATWISNADKVLTTSFPSFDFTPNGIWRMRPPSPSGPVLRAFHSETTYRVYVSGGVLPTISSTASVGYFAPGHTVIAAAQPPQYGTFIEWEFFPTPVTFTDGTSETDATVKFVMPGQDIEVKAVYEYDYPPEPPKPDPFIILSTTDDDCAINLIAETVIIPAGYEVRGYSVNGGKSWKKGALPTDQAKLSKLFDKEMTLWLTDRTDGRGKPIVHDPVKFPRIQARPKANPEKLKAWYGEDTWAPKGTNGAAPMRTYEYAETTDKKNPTTAWQPIPDGGFPVLSGTTKKTYLFRAPATAYDGRYVPASKIFKITPANFGKAPNYVVKTDRKTGDKTVKLKKNDWYELSGEAAVKASAAMTLNVTGKAGTLTVWKAETGKKPRSEKKVIELG